MVSLVPTNLGMKDKTKNNLAMHNENRRSASESVKWQEDRFGNPMQ